jgi:type II secretory ATPase GspE/PulE/Tfp pilus assembly ATPase PilB-like protein
MSGGVRATEEELRELLRLLDMGIEPFVLASTLRLVVALFQDGLAKVCRGEVTIDELERVTE